MMEMIICPVCGKKAVIRSWCISSKELYNPYCPNCHLTFHSDGECPEGYPLLFSTTEQAISSWNRRTPNEELAALRAELDAVKRERDAAVGDIDALCTNHYEFADEYDRLADMCTVYCVYGKTGKCFQADPNNTSRCIKFKWRGLPEATNADQTAQD